MITATIVVPLLNANEPEARVVKLHAAEGTLVEKGTLLITIETTKAATDIESPERGFLRILVKENDSLIVGDTLAVITEHPDEPVDVKTSPPLDMNESLGLRITKPARHLAESQGIDLATLPRDRLITEKFIRQLSPSLPISIDLPEKSKPYLVVFGGGGHAKSIIELVNQAREFTIAGIVDDRLPSGTKVLGV
jgi:pyruvate/2-oxoglutarate dehydrogenase complex dihydrolipoamide acyltransferase (E2) component